MYWCWSGCRSIIRKVLRAFFFLVLSITCAAVEIDHFTVAVKDLDESAKVLSKAGFTLKKPHVYKSGLQKGLKTQAVRLASGQYFQIVSVGENPGPLGRWYLKFLKNHEGGATVVIKRDGLSELEKIFNKAAIPTRLVKNIGYDWLSFKTEGPFHNLSFITYRNPPHITPNLTRHANSAQSIKRLSINAPGDPFQWAKIMKLAESEQVGLNFVTTGAYKNPQLFIPQVEIEVSKNSKKSSFILGKTLFSLKTK